MIHLQKMADLLAASKDNKVYVILTERSEDSFQHLLLSVMDNDNIGNILSISFGNSRRDLAFAAHSAIIEKLGQNGYKVISGRVGTEIGLTASFGLFFDSNGELLVDIQPYKETEAFPNADTHKGIALEGFSITPENIDALKKHLENIAENGGIIKEGTPEKRKRNTKDTK
jgi:hypothetical protein